MRPEGGGRARRYASLIGLGCLLGAATVGGTTFLSPAPTSASCSTQHQNVVAQDSSGFHYGNKGQVYVNDSSVINNLHDALYRSLFIFIDNRNWVEVGWGAGPNNITGQAYPTVYAYWVNGGSPGQFSYKFVQEGTNDNFRVENNGDIGIWAYYFDGESPPFTYSPIMTFNKGLPLANSEHYNTCDSLWTHMYGLNYRNVLGDWSSSYGDLECNENTASPDWFLYKNSNSEMHVYSSPSGTLC